MTNKITISNAQKTAVTHGAGPMLVLAGPGSGKTFVLTQRIQNLITNLTINPSNILVITFTKAAACEMQERFLNLMKDTYAPVHFGTFHAVFYKILQHTYQYSQKDILTEREKKEILTDIFMRMDDIEATGGNGETGKIREIGETRETGEIGEKQETRETGEIGEKQETRETGEEKAKKLISEFSSYKNSGRPLSKYEPKCMEKEEFDNIFLAYKREVTQMRKLDFDDMVLLCHKLLKERPDVLCLWQAQYQYFLIDEFQDINTVQYETIKLLAGESANIFAVGDDDQSIYGFRGANPTIMKQFLADYNNAKQVLLDKNFRSTKNIVKAASQVISHNKNRFEKQIVTENENGDTIKVIGFQDTEAQYTYLIDDIKNGEQKYTEIAVLCRTSSDMGSLAERFMECDIPFVMKEKVNNIYEHFIAKDIISYIKFASEGYPRAEFLKIMNRPKRYISRVCLEDENIDFNKLFKQYIQKPYMKEKLQKCRYDMQQISNMNPYAAVQYIRKGVGYEEYVKQSAIKNGVQESVYIEILNEMSKRAKHFKSFGEWFIHIADYKEQLSQKKDTSEGVGIYTLHGSKGLEFHTVYILNVNERNIPHHKAVLDTEIEEERRLFYVGMTRAKKKLIICYTKEEKNERKKSLFLYEMKSVAGQE